MKRECINKIFSSISTRQSFCSSPAYRDSGQREAQGKETLSASQTATPSSALSPAETVDSHVGHQFTGEWLGGDVVRGVGVCADVEGGLRRRNAGAAEVEETHKWRLGCRDDGCIDVREWLVSIYSRGSNSMTVGQRAKPGQS
ncbi:hypothetical protein C8J56DRAFT_898865 [Mycena floridula]|nr:hypothetical protein C8J56DRAFT_898865 [Mycena floridula]